MCDVCNVCQMCVYVVRVMCVMCMGKSSPSPMDMFGGLWCGTAVVQDDGVRACFGVSEGVPEGPTTCSRDGVTGCDCVGLYLISR